MVCHSASPLPGLSWNTGHQMSVLYLVITIRLKHEFKHGSGNVVGSVTFDQFIQHMTVKLDQLRTSRR